MIVISRIFDATKIFGPKTSGPGYYILFSILVYVLFFGAGYTNIQDFVFRRQTKRKICHFHPGFVVSLLRTAWSSGQVTSCFREHTLSPKTTALAIIISIFKLPDYSYYFLCCQFLSKPHQTKRTFFAETRC